MAFDLIRDLALVFYCEDCITGAIVEGAADVGLMAGGLEGVFEQVQQDAAEQDGIRVDGEVIEAAGDNPFAPGAIEALNDLGLLLEQLGGGRHRRW